MQTAVRTSEATRTTTDVAIIGAGPYGLSIAAFLRSRGVDFRIFGGAMETWRTQMPKGMFLKSEGFASNLYDPESAFRLAHFCADRHIDYADVGVPVSLETFVAYGDAFQKRFVPDLDERKIVDLKQTSSGFELRLVDGEIVHSRKVVVAVGISHYAYIPPDLAHLTPNFVSHSSQHRDLERFKGRSVAVVGAGASALDLAALLGEAGAAVQLVARAKKVNFHDPPDNKPRSIWTRLRHPRSGLGTGLKLRFYSDLPQVLHRLPPPLRLAMARDHVPAAGWFTKEYVVGKVPLHLGASLAGAEIRDERVLLRLQNCAGAPSELVVDHVIAATGFKVDLGRIAFLGEELRRQIRYVDDVPALSANFESGVKGLYFVGASALYSFGPLLRFAYGARFTAKRLSAHFARRRSITR